MAENEFASNAKANTGVSLGAVGLGLAALPLLNNGALGGLLGGGISEQSKLLAENTLLKSQQYGDQNLTPVRIEQARQAEQIIALRTEMGLREQITDGKIAATAQAANAGISQVQMALGMLKQTVDSFSSTYVEAGRVTPLPAPNPFPPVPPYGPYPPYWPFFPPPATPPAADTTKASGGTTGTGA